MTTRHRISTAAMFVAALAVPVAADWTEADGHKMHYPQMPAPSAWDVYTISPVMLADDFLCTESGPVTGIHFWGSWAGDIPDAQLAWLDVTIWDNIPANANEPDSYSMPGERLWGRRFHPEEFTIDEWGRGSQGWYNPCPQDFFLNDHEKIYQINMMDIQDPFEQEKGEVYWLGITGQVHVGDFGWNNSLDHREDDAVYRCFDDIDGAWGPWHELRGPLTNVSMDLAFVIIPEPTTLALLGLGGMAVLVRRRRT